MNHICEILGRYFFEPAPAQRLGVLRLFIGGYALWYVFTRWDLFEKLGDKSNTLWDPVGIMRLFSDPIDSVAVDWLIVATLMSGLMFVVGWMFQYSGPTFAFLLFCTLCYRNSWSMIYHMHNVLVLHVAVLGLSSSGDAFSLDGMGWNGSRRTEENPHLTSWEYGWPIRLIIAVTASIYFLAGFAKITGPSGLGWASGESMRSQVAIDAIRKEILEDGAMDAAFLLYDQVWLFALMGIATYVLELGAPLFLFSKRAGKLWAVLTWGMHWGILVIMGIKFRYQLAFIMFLPYFEVEIIATWAMRGWNALVAIFHRQHGEQAKTG